MEATRTVTTVTALPVGVAAAGTLTQDTQVPTVLHGTGTDLYEALKKARIFLFFPSTSPPQLLEVADFAAVNDPVLPQSADWVKVKTAPAVAISGESFQVVSATLKSFRVEAIGAGKFDNVAMAVGQIIDAPISYSNGSGPIIPKAAHWVDGTSGALAITEQF